jgi:hypothetical protein
VIRTVFVRNKGSKKENKKMKAMRNGKSENKTKRSRLKGSGRNNLPCFNKKCSLI